MESNGLKKNSGIENRIKERYGWADDETNVEGSSFCTMESGSIPIVRLAELYRVRYVIILRGGGSSFLFDNTKEFTPQVLLIPDVNQKFVSKIKFPTILQYIWF